MKGTKKKRKKRRKKGPRAGDGKIESLDGQAIQRRPSVPITVAVVGRLTVQYHLRSIL